MVGTLNNRWDSRHSSVPAILFIFLACDEHIIVGAGIAGNVRNGSMPLPGTATDIASVRYGMSPITRSLTCLLSGLTKMGSWPAVQ